MKTFLIGVMVGVIIVFSTVVGIAFDRIVGIKGLDKYFSRQNKTSIMTSNEENMVINVTEKAGSGVVTVAVSAQRQVISPIIVDPFGNSFGSPETKFESVQKDIGTGFVVDESGLVVTNKHVVGDVSGAYKVISKDNTEYEVKNIYRDPVNDLAILKIEPKEKQKLEVLSMGDSGNLKVGQYVVAIGTALGEFRQTVTHGVISGLARGITAGDGMGAERLEDIIQTDAAINPGNSGGPLLSTSGEVIGVNVAVAGGAQNIGFAIPINVIKDSIENFKTTGQFNRPMMGVRYRMLDKDTAILNDLPEGAYVVEVVPDSSAAKANIKRGDIVISIDGKKVKEIKGGLAGVVTTHKIGDVVEVEYFRDKTVSEIKMTLEGSK